MGGMEELICVGKCEVADMKILSSDVGMRLNYDSPF